MTHDSYRELIQRELDDDLSPEELVVLEAHLTTCTDCLREREEYKCITVGLARLSKVMPERSFVPQINLAEWPQSQQPKTVQRRIAPAWWRGLSVAAVVVLAIGFSTDWNFELDDQSLSSTKVAQGPDNDRQQPTHTDVAQTAPPVSTFDQQQVVLNLPPQTTATPSTPATGSSAQVPEVVSKPTDSLRTVDVGRTAANTNKSAIASSNAMPVAKKDDSVLGINVPAANRDKGAGVQKPTGAGGVVAATLLPVISVGATPAFLDQFNAQLQQQVNNGDASVAWSTDSYKVVQHCLTALGFSANALLLTTDDLSRVHVLQDGVVYEVQLEQPFDQGAKGIWRPVRIGRGINETNSVGYEQAILNYFNAQLVHGILFGRQEVFVIRNFDRGTISVTVNEQRNEASDQHTWENVQYDLTLVQNPREVWSVKDIKMIQA